METTLDNNSASAAREEASVLASVIGEDGDMLRFENATFTIDGLLTGTAYSLALTARGIIVVRSREIRLIAQPPLITPVRVKLADIDVLEMEKPIFEPRRLRANVRNSGSLCIEASTLAATDALYESLKNLMRVLRESPPTLPRLRRSGVHIALIDPLNPNTLTLTELLHHVDDDDNDEDDASSMSQ